MVFFSLLAVAQEPARVMGTAPQQAGSPYLIILRNLHDSGGMLNTRGTPLSLVSLPHKTRSEGGLFYPVLVLLLVLAVMKTLYSRYFETLFRVFFNTSLRQSQLTDQLLQARVPSFFFNLFFVVSGGLYIYLLLKNSGNTSAHTADYLWLFCMIAVAGCYLVKYLSLQFAGWLTGCGAEASSYLFIIFLLNKVIGILLLPFIIILAFSSKTPASIAGWISVLLILLAFFIRFFRSYAMLGNKIRVGAFHFGLYIIAAEILPIALIYKAVAQFLAFSS